MINFLFIYIYVNPMLCFFLSNFAVIWFVLRGIYCSIVSERQYYSHSLYTRHAQRL